MVPVISLVPKRNLEKELEDKTKSELADFKSKLTKKSRYSSMCVKQRN